MAGTECLAEITSNAMKGARDAYVVLAPEWATVANGCEVRVLASALAVALVLLVPAGAQW